MIHIQKFQLHGLTNHLLKSLFYSDKQDLISFCISDEEISLIMSQKNALNLPEQVQNFPLVISKNHWRAIQIKGGFDKDESGIINKFSKYFALNKVNHNFIYSFDFKRHR